MRDEPGTLAAHDAEGIGHLIGQSVAEARAYAGARLTLVKTQASYLGSALITPAALGGVALLLALNAFMLILLAAVFALAPLVGHALAALIVAVTATLLAGLLAWLAARQGSAAVAQVSKAP